MSQLPRLSRRSLLALVAGFPAFAAASRGLAGPRDQGIGGTGASISPAEDEGDRGIGGTGVIGTIRRFGSIVVNGMRISYPEDANVRIDGAAATPTALKIGQVVRVVALETNNQFSTKAINVTSEVIGRVEKVGAKSLTVLGQNVSLAHLPKTQRRFGYGAHVAVSGLRRPDGIIVASLIEMREPGLEQVAGPVAIGGDGALTIGDLKLTGADPAFIGQRAVMQGQLVDGAFKVAHAKTESALLGANLKALSIEAYVERGADGLHLGSGLPVSGSGDFGLPLNQTVRAVLETSPGAGGQWRVDSVRLNGAGAPGMPGMPGGAPSPQLPGGGGGGNLGGPGFHGAPAGAPSGAPHGLNGSFGAPSGQAGGLGMPGAPPGAGAGGFGGPGGAQEPPGFGSTGGFGGPGFGGPGLGGPGGAGPGGFGGPRR